jgi:hypothetical protein
MEECILDSLRNYCLKKRASSSLATGTTMKRPKLYREHITYSRASNYVQRTKKDRRSKGWQWRVGKHGTACKYAEYGTIYEKDIYCKHYKRGVILSHCNMEECPSYYWKHERRSGKDRRKKRA